MTAKICSLAGTAVSKWADILFKHGRVKESCLFYGLKNPVGGKNQEIFTIPCTSDEGCHSRGGKKHQKKKNGAPSYIF